MSCYFSLDTSKRFNSVVLRGRPLLFCYFFLWLNFLFPDFFFPQKKGASHNKEGQSDPLPDNM